jgi:hypothetical protein
VELTASKGLIPVAEVFQDWNCDALTCDRFWQILTDSDRCDSNGAVNVFKLSYISWTPHRIVLCMLLALDHSLNPAFRVLHFISCFPVAFFSIICLLLVRPSSMKQLPGAC